MRITILAVLLLISTSISGQILEKDILGAWQASESATYNFSETGGQLVLTVVYKQDNEGDWKTLLFGGVVVGNTMNLCSVDGISPFDACYNGVINSRGSISLSLSNCIDRILGACGSLTTAILLERDIIFESSGIYFLAATGEYFLINDNAGLADVVQVNITDSRGDNFSGTKLGNNGELVPVDNQGRTLSYVVNSDRSITATVSGCLNISEEVCSQIPPGTQFELEKI